MASCTLNGYHINLFGSSVYKATYLNILFLYTNQPSTENGYVTHELEFESKNMFVVIKLVLLY